MGNSTKRPCAWCGQEFQTQRVTAKFCGGTCRQRANRAGRGTQGQSDSVTPTVTGLGFELLMSKAALKLAASQIVDEFVGKAGKTARLMVWELRIVEKLTPFLSGEEVISKAALAEVLGTGYTYYESASDLLTQIRERLTSLEEQLKDEKARVKDEKARVEHYRDLYDSYREKLNDRLNRRTAGESKGLSTEDWETLTKMDDVQLAQWTKVGRALHRQGRREAGQDAVRWVQGNRMDQSKGSNADGNATVDSLGPLQSP